MIGVGRVNRIKEYKNILDKYRYDENYNDSGCRRMDHKDCKDYNKMRIVIVNRKMLVLNNEGKFE